MVRFARQSSKYKQLTLNTNALARNTKYYADLKDAGLNTISVSVDSFNPEIAETCRSGTKTDKLKGRLTDIIALYAPTPVTVTIVVSRRNMHDVPTTLETLNTMGNVNVELQTLIVYDEEKGDKGSTPYSMNETEWHTLFAEIRTPDRYPNLSIVGGQPNQPMPTRCQRPFISPYITAEGYLTPCCTCEDPSVLGYSDVAKQPLTELWHTNPLQTFLKNYVKYAHAICKGCCFWSG